MPCPMMFALQSSNLINKPALIVSSSIIPCPEEGATQHHLGDGHGHGPVRDEEVVLHAVFEKTRREGNRLRRDAFDQKQLKHAEVSVARSSYINRATFTKNIVTPLTPTMGEFIGAASAAVSELRKIIYRLENAKPPVEGRAICVLDKVSESEHESHAALGFSATYGSLPEAWKKKLRPIIQEDVAAAFEEAVSLEQALLSSD
jgi:hypothetical protein